MRPSSWSKAQRRRPPGGRARAGGASPAPAGFPAGVAPAVAAACGIAGLAGWLPLEWRAPVRPGETVLVLGATGTVGLVAVQAARILGAGRGVAPRARLVQLGQSAGSAAAVPAGAVRGKELEILGYTNLRVPFDVLAAAYTRLVGPAGA